MSFQNSRPYTSTGRRPSQNNNPIVHNINPLAIPSLKSLDVEKLEDDIAKELKSKKIVEQRGVLEVKKICDASPEIQELKNRIKLAHLNQERSQQIVEKQVRKLNNINEDAETDEMLLKRLEEEKQREYEKEMKKKHDMLNSKYVLQKQMKDRDKQREESKAEYLRDRELVDNIVKNIMQEDMNMIMEDKRKKEQARGHMYAAYAEKEERLRQQKENDRIQKEKERKYFEELEKRANEQKEMKAAKDEEKNKIFERLAAEAERKQQEKEYWENVRNEMYVEELNRREKIKNIMEAEKRQKQKEEMLQSLIDTRNLKEHIKEEEAKAEREFKKKLMDKFAEDERLEQLNAQKRKLKEFEYKKEIERQWQEKRIQYQNQKELELQELQRQKKEESYKRQIIEQEKLRLIKEHEEILKTFFKKGYDKSVNGLKNN